MEYQDSSFFITLPLYKPTIHTEKWKNMIFAVFTAGYLHYKRLNCIRMFVISRPGAGRSLVASRQITQIKGLDVISGFELAFDSCLTAVINMKSKFSENDTNDVDKTI